jgi:hypothetical protein
LSLGIIGKLLTIGNTEIPKELQKKEVGKSQYKRSIVLNYKPKEAAGLERTFKIQLKENGEVEISLKHMMGDKVEADYKVALPFGEFYVIKKLISVKFLNYQIAFSTLIIRMGQDGEGI